MIGIIPWDLFDDCSKIVEGRWIYSKSSHFPRKTYLYSHIAFFFNFMKVLDLSSTEHLEYVTFYGCLAGLKL